MLDWRVGGGGGFSAVIDISKYVYTIESERFIPTTAPFVLGIDGPRPSNGRGGPVPRTTL